MASTSGGLHGGRRDSSGRKRKHDSVESRRKSWNSQHKRIYLLKNMFEAWKDAKIVAGYSSCSDSDFAAHLLSLEYRRRSDPNQSQRQKQSRITQQNADHGTDIGTCDVNISQAQETSTPLKGRESLHPSFQSESPILGKQPDGNIMETDVNLSFTGSDVPLGESSTIDPLDTMNATNVSIFTDDEETTDESSLEDNVSLHNLTKSVIEDLNAERQSDSDSMDDSSNGDFEGDEPDMYPMSDEQQPDMDDVQQPQMDDSQQSSSTPPITFGPHQKLSRGDEMYAMKEEYNMVQERKFVCSLDLLLAAFQARCQTPGCTALPNIKYHFVGITLIVNCLCSSGHKYRFCTSHQVNEIYASNLQAAASIILSGSHYAKVERMAKFLNLEFLSKSTYYRFQRLYLVPEINEWWCWMRGEVIMEFSGKDVVVGGDGQCDSPGFNAKNLCYFMMEVESNYILDIEVLDKRHVGLISTNMEKEAVRRSLDRVTKEIKVVELVTDASTSVKALLGSQYKDIVHSLDVWHKSKSIKKCLAKLGKPKAMQKIKDWSSHIIRHFWYCSSECRQDDATSDDEALRLMKDKWIGLLHHICNDHQWLGGQCDHDDDDNHDESLSWFDRRDKDFIELQKVILNPDLLASFKYYTRFRHTGGIECANSLGLVYTPKRTPFKYQVYKARRQLTAIDWNFHLGLKQMKSQSGEDMVTRKYNPRTREWDIKKVKCAKGYEYIPLLISHVLRKRVMDVDGVTQTVDLNKSDPSLISPTIAHVPPPPAKEIAARRSRFVRK